MPEHIAFEGSQVERKGKRWMKAGRFCISQLFVWETKTPRYLPATKTSGMSRKRVSNVILHNRASDYCHLVKNNCTRTHGPKAWRWYGLLTLLIWVWPGWAVGLGSGWAWQGGGVRSAAPIRSSRMDAGEGGFICMKEEGREMLRHFFSRYSLKGETRQLKVNEFSPEFFKWCHETDPRVVTWSLSVFRHILE